EENIVIPELGRVIEVSVNEITAVSTVTAGAVLVDGLGVGDVGNVVLRDRKHLGEDGIMVVSVTLSDKGAILAGPDILSRGFVYVKDSEELIEKTKEVVEKAVLSGIAENKRDWQNLKTKIRDAAGGYIYTVTQRSPMILPLINEIKEKDFNKEENQ
ncbi:MAG: ribonuclease J, partial [Oscillospiraceae bacterium]|nr:ribonuclease J [Oscillospiraceae bacterium]